MPKDISQYSDQELEAIAGGGGSPDLSHLSDGELEKIASGPSRSVHEDVPLVLAPNMMRQIEGMSQPEAADRGYSEGLLLGFSGEMKAGINTLKGQGGYRENVEKEREREQAAQYAHPKTYHGSEAAGALTSSLPFKANPLSAAVLGGIYGLGKSEANLTSPGLQDIAQASTDVANGFTAGAVGGKMAQELPAAFSLVADSKVGKALLAAPRQVIEKLPEGLRDWANHLRLKSTGALQSDISKVDRGPGGMKFRRGLGQAMKDEGLSGVTMGPRAIHEASQGKIQELGGDIGKVVDTAENYVNSMPFESQNRHRVNIPNLADRLEKEIYEPMKDSLALKGEAEKFKSQYIDPLREKGDVTMGIKEAFKQRRDFDELLDSKWNQEHSPTAVRFIKQYRGILQNEIDNTVSKVQQIASKGQHFPRPENVTPMPQRFVRDPKTGQMIEMPEEWLKRQMVDAKTRHTAPDMNSIPPLSPEEAANLARYRDLRQRFRKVKKIEGLAEKGTQRAEGNHYVSLTDAMAALGGWTATHDPIKGGAAFVVNQLRRKRGNQIGAAVADTAATGLEMGGKLAKEVGQRLPIGSYPTIYDTLGKTKDAKKKSPKDR